MKTSGIYQIQSKLKPERCYIGSAINIGTRWDIHLHHLRNNTHHSKKLQNHYNKHGESDLFFSILLGCDNEDLIKAEQYFIDSYNPYFNICRIAGSVLGCKWKLSDQENKAKSKRQLGKKRPPFSEEVRKTMSLANIRRGAIPPSRKGIKATEATRLKMSIAKKGKPIGVGRKLTKEHKDNISLGHIGKVCYWKGKKQPQESTEKKRASMLRIWELKKAL